MEQGVIKSPEQLYGNIEYTWNTLSDFHPETAKAIHLGSARMAQLPSEPREILIGTGQLNQLNIVELAVHFATGKLMQTPGFASVVLAQPIPFGISEKHVSAIGCATFQVMEKEGEASMLYVLLKMAGATEAQYRQAQTTYLNKLNEVLESIGFNQIPPIAS